jgi:hypothetical protein
VAQWLPQASFTGLRAMYSGGRMHGGEPRRPQGFDLGMGS